MCGIAGIVSFRPGAPTAPSDAIAVMTDILAHRGPDDRGVWSGDGAHLGHRRLSIIDREHGHQPMRGDAGRVIVFNGEIYNYREIRETLQAKGRRFSTDTDTEVLLHAFAEWGEECVERFNGMFAFAIWDQERRKLFIARDRLGKKPFFYYCGADFFAFSSEMKALLTIPEVKERVEIDPRALSDYLSLGYILSPKSIFRPILKLPPATLGWVCPESARLTTRRYWMLEDFYLAPKHPDSPETEARFAELFHDAVKIRMHADVPLAGFLSGGIDSAAVLSAMMKESPETTRGICMGFAERSFDETARARVTAGHLGAPLDTLDHRHTNKEGLAHLIWHIDEPFADTSMLPTFQLCQTAKERITVALSGDGADEILAGYSIYKADALYDRYRHLPMAVQRMLLAGARKWLRPSYRKVSFDYKARQFLGSVGMSRREAHYWWRNIFSETEKCQLLSRELLEEIGDYTPFQVFDQYHDRVAEAGFLDQCLYVDAQTWLVDDILVKTDRMSMANGLEVRSPFLDYRLVEFAARLPLHLKFDGTTSKVLMRRAFRDVLPRKTITGPKRGFNAPVKKSARLNLKDRHDRALFNPDFTLHPDKEDVTFKSFVLSGLDAWMRMERHYTFSSSWTHDVKDHAE
ncbi:MAG: asparagine synthase (glutamine-hydrolyzing) [Alphaproteobacteria bacterium]|nr:asparagine synthase (glutamine-hydrolyzing) [Alphaproteobacteria bacterium]MBF0249700.1 asparagine synthase (glutamine-hydrolyzing) [Alphaproteobacteria bacterium]